MSFRRSVRAFFFGALVALAGFSGSFAWADGAQSATTRPGLPDDTTFLKSLFRIQFDQHLNGQERLDVDPTQELNVDRCVSILQDLTPGSVTVFGVGHEGWARIKGTPIEAHPAITKDSLAVWREACDKTGVQMFVYVSSLINSRLAAAHPEYSRQFYNGGIADQRLDHNSKYVDDCLLPFVETVMQRYRPDGIWFDGDFWAVFPSWNPASSKKFTAETGLAPPVNFGDPRMVEFWRFTIDSHEQYMHRVADLIHKYNPKCSFVVNATNTLRQPISPPPYLGRINIDPPLFFGMETACLESRFQTGRSNIPFDIVLGGYAEPEGSFYSGPKTPLQLSQETATVVANGGRIGLYTSINPNGSIDLQEVKRIRNILAEFVLPRKACLIESTSVPDIALLHTRDHFDRTHRLNEIRGAGLSVLRSNHHFSIVDDATFMRRAAAFNVCVVPEQGKISPQLAKSLTEFVERGGGLVISQGSVDREEPAKPQAELATLLPIKSITEMSEAARVETPDGPTGLDGGWTKIELSIPAEADLEASGETGPSSPTRFKYSVGKGRVVLLSGAYFNTYGEGCDPKLRHVLDESLLWAAGSSKRVVAKAPEWIEVVWRKTGETQIVHLVNHARGQEFRPRSSVVEYVPPSGEISLSVPMDRAPSRVTLVPGNVSLPFKWNDNAVMVQVPPVAVHSAVLIEP